jgi:hypothetical protein
MRLRRNLIWVLWAASALVTIALFFIPAFIIRPFTHQSARGIVAAMALRDRAPLGTLLAALVCLALTFLLWSSAKLWRRIGLGLVAALVLFSTVMARQNYFEWMFHPVANAQFVNEADSKLDAGEMILAVRFGSDARAYPISQMAYHHILNDVVEGVPVAVTY